MTSSVFDNVDVTAVRDEKWIVLCAILGSHIDPSSPEAIGFRDRLNSILKWAMRSIGIKAYQARQNEPRAFKRRRRTSEARSPTSPFGEAASAGRDFLVMLDGSFEFLKWVDMLDGRGGRPLFNVGLDLETRRELELLIGLMERLDGELQAYVGRSDGVQRPNSKPWLHDAVFKLWMIWIDAGQIDRSQADFELFAYESLLPTGAVTPEAIKGSLKRHVRPKFERWKRAGHLVSN